MSLSNLPLDPWSLDQVRANALVRAPRGRKLTSLEAKRLSPEESISLAAKGWVTPRDVRMIQARHGLGEPATTIAMDYEISAYQVVAIVGGHWAPFRDAEAA